MAGTPPSPLLRDALATATAAHAGQVRNGAGGIPYVEHPVAVAALLAEHGWDADEVQAAALLHDVVEDSETTLTELRERFGEPVAWLVDALSDDAAIAGWGARKSEHRARVARAGPQALAIYAADKLTNARALRGAYEVQGAAVEEELKVPLEAKLTAWEEDLAMLRQAAAALDFLDELAAELSALRAAASALPPGGR